MVSTCYYNYILWVRCWARCFVCITSFNSGNNPLWQVLLLALFYGLGLEKLRNFFMATQLVCHGVAPVIQAHSDSRASVLNHYTILPLVKPVLLKLRCSFSLESCPHLAFKSFSFEISLSISSCMNLTFRAPDSVRISPP